MRTLFQITLVLMISLLGAWALAAAPIAAPVQEKPITLPTKFKGGPNQLTFLDFYSAYCGTCQMMEPILKSLELETGDKVKFQQVDLVNPDNDAIGDAFGITGTPSYFLFDADGKLVYQMTDVISPKILRAQVLRKTNQLKVYPFPPDIKPLATIPKEAAYTLVTFEDASCPDCDTNNKYLNAMQFAEENHLSVVHLNPQDAAVKKFMKTLDLTDTPSYVLFDNQNRELLRMAGKETNPELFWRYYTMLNTSKNTGDGDTTD